MSSNCSEVQEQLAAYSLGALDVRERRAVDLHLGVCADCRDILAQYEQTAESMLMSTPGIDPPANLRARLIKEISTAKSVPEHRVARPVFPLRSLAGVFALGLLLVLNVSLLLQTRSISARQEELVSQMEADRTVLSLAAYPETRMVSLQGDRAYGTLVYEPELNVAVLYAWGLDELGVDQTYQAWLIEPGGGRVSGGLFKPESNERFARLIIYSASSLEGFTGLGVTIEPAGGSSGPTGPKVLGVDL